MHSPRTALLILGLALVLSGCHKEGPTPEAADKPTEAQPANPPGSVGAVVLAANAPELQQMTIESVHTLATAAEAVSAPAKIEANPNRIARAMLPIPGRIVHVMAKLGDSVTKGQPLVTIESTTVAESASAYAQAEAGVHQAQLSASKADADLARLSDLYEHQAVAQKEVLAAKTTAEVAASAVEQAKSALEQAKNRLELLGLSPGRYQQTVTVAAPISGKVLEVSVVEGEFRNELSAPLITIADLSRVWASSDMPESKIRYCKVGGVMDLELIAYPGEVFHGRVTRIADTVNPETRTVKVSTELDNTDGRLRPEMFGQLRYADGQISAPWIPSAAVVRVGEKDVVFVEQRTGQFAAMPVELGQPRDEGYAVTAGLKAGDRIVTKGAVYLKASL